MASLSLRIVLDTGGRIGPGKVGLLEHIDACGSIAEAARRMGMSYKRAWDLVEEMNSIFGKPAVETQKGGPGGGGARLTPAGRAVVDRFRAIEAAALTAAAAEMAALLKEIGEG